MQKRDKTKAGLRSIVTLQASYSHQRL